MYAKKMIDAPAKHARRVAPCTFLAENRLAEEADPGIPVAERNRYQFAESMYQEPTMMTNRTTDTLTTTIVALNRALSRMPIDQDEQSPRR